MRSPFAAHNAANAGVFLTTGTSAASVRSDELLAVTFNTMPFLTVPVTLTFASVAKPFVHFFKFASAFLASTPGAPAAARAVFTAAS